MTRPENVTRIPPRQPLRDIADLTILVRVPGKPGAARTFATSEADEAQQYADKHGGECLDLPLANSVWDWDNGRWLGSGTTVHDMADPLRPSDA
jgi:hypothetical protein